jgi:hypothetical protein
MNKKFEYKRLFTDKPTNVVTEVNDLGNDGWELVTVTVDHDNIYSFFFKREKE